MMTRMRRAVGSGSAGVSLIEMLVAALLLGIVGAIGTSMLVGAQRSADVTVAAHQSVEEARLAMNRVSRELRQASNCIRSRTASRTSGRSPAPPFVWTWATSCWRMRGSQ